MIPVRVIKLDSKAHLPQYMTAGAAGCDAVCCLESPVTIAPQERVALSTGLAFEIPAGFEIQVRPRSGMAFRDGLTVVNAPGTIDSDYRGEVKILLVNLSDKPVTVKHGDRVAQFVLNRVEQIGWVETEQLEHTLRGAGGFGSTGLTHSGNEVNVGQFE